MVLQVVLGAVVRPLNFAVGAVDSRHVDFRRVLGIEADNLQLFRVAGQVVGAGHHDVVAHSPRL